MRGCFEKFFKWCHHRQVSGKISAGANACEKETDANIHENMYQNTRQSGRHDSTSDREKVCKSLKVTANGWAHYSQNF